MLRGSRFGLPDALAGAQKLPVEVAVFENVSVNKAESADADPGQDFGYRSTQSTQPASLPTLTLPWLPWSCPPSRKSPSIWC